jgi:DNA gyrase inhibitor GyrI
MATETPEYKVIRQEGKFELREYPTLTVARTPLGNGDFMRLFRYISGGNEREQKIAMTAPVLVTHEGSDAGMGFIMPSNIQPSAVPKATSKEIKLDEMKSGLFAVYQYSGGRNEKNEADALKLLRAWMQEKKLTPAQSAPMFGYYDPPWIPTFMRRNEVLLLVEADSVTPSTQQTSD